MKYGGRIIYEALDMLRRTVAFYNSFIFFWLPHYLDLVYKNKFK